MSFVGLLDLPDVRPTLSTAREAVDAALRRPALRRCGGRLAVEMGLRSAVASAALEGHSYGIEEVRSGTVTDPVMQGALRVSAALEGLAPLWGSAPRQALARLHVLAAKDVPGVHDESLGRPITGPEVGTRLEMLCELVTSPGATTPALLRAAVVHGELLALHPFAGPAGVVARACARLTLIADGLDPCGLLAPEVGHLARQPEYVGSANAFATGTPDGVRAWLKHCAASVREAAEELAALADGFPPPS